MIGAKEYNVTLQAIVNVRVSAVEADTPEDAISAALDRVNLHSLLGRQKPTPSVEYTEYAEDVHEALVDIVGDEEYKQSLWYTWRKGSWVPAPADPNEELRLLDDQAKALRKELGHSQPDEVSYCRTWKCPECGKTVEHSYEALAEVGTPICSDCDVEMELR